MPGIRRATGDDLGRLSVTAMRSFTPDPLMRWLIPDDEQWAAMGVPFFGRAITNWLAHDETWCTDDVVALAAWIPPGRPELPDPPASQAENDRPAAAPPEELMERLAVLRPALDEHAPAEPHWYLQLLGTHPDWQRQGLGADLMAVMFERAATEGRPCYLETQTAANVAYYRHHGFEVRSEWDLPLDGPHMWGMLRPAP